MADVKSNMLPKVIVFGMLAAAVLVGLKACSGNKSAEKPQQAQNVLANMSPEELRALGVEGDTPEDTLRTLVGTLRTTRAQQAELQKNIDNVLKENEALRKRNSNVSGQVNEAVAGFQKQAQQRQQQLQEQQQTLMGRIQSLTDQLASNKDKAKSDSDMPLGLGLDGMGAGSGSATAGDDGLMWVGPKDQKEVDPRNPNSAKEGPQFPTSFLSDNAITRQKAKYEQQVKGHTNEKGEEEGAEPVFTLPENSTLVGSRAMTALLGRVPINGTVTDPYPFKLMIGKDNLTANGIELPDVEGAIVSGTASGDWTLSCVRGQVNSITFVFADGTVRTLPHPDTNMKANSNSNSGNNGKDVSTTAGIGWISDDSGIPCIGGERKSNASTYLPTIAGLSAASAAGDGISQGQYTSQNNVNGITSTMTGNAGQAVLGKALSGGMKETADWVRERYGMMFDAIYVPPGQKLAVHITRQLAIDFETKGRKVRYDDFSLPGEGGGAGGLD
ncbi:integrating conjugative element protein, PFL_4705 family [Serratia marcescens]|uniref:TIGR03752 family integrating conjugative element protein n=1 Tax=Serratia marcescens TaxID=615 RepID=UPI00217B35C5|nr:TIGR03752 family integrating conjugative element protein [Serratia marcescens]CAI1826461.1 integrating conjugative element protein, PFL_4705 family [Serratia marcescens]